MTISFSGNLYGGETSAVREVIVHVDELGQLTLVDMDMDMDMAMDPVAVRDIRISSRVGNSARYLDFPSGVRVETWANAEVDVLQSHWKSSSSSLAYRLEKSRRFIIGGTLAMVAGTYAFVVYGVPALSAIVTTALPTSLDDRLGGEVLEQLDEYVFTPSDLSATRQDDLSALFAILTPDNDRDYQITFRTSELLGANALALPNAQVIMTDQLVKLSDDNDMLAAIMLHEIGHIVERHSMQSVVRQAGLSILIFAVTGDVNSAATALIVLLPAFLIQSQYSRDLEWEADTYALEQMRARQMDTNKFADIMERLVNSGGDEDNVDDSKETEEPFSDYFSTHPATRARVERFRH